MAKKLFIFAIGGTGARVLRSFTMMAAAGLEKFESDTSVIPIIIDHDRQCGDKDRATKALTQYHTIHNSLYSNTNERNGFFMTNFTPLSHLGVKGGKHAVKRESWCLDFGPEGNMKYSKYLGLDSMQSIEALKPTEGLLKALYDTSDSDEPTAELELNLNVGFKGKPNIGTVVFHDIKGTNEFDWFLGQCGPDDKVFIIGSLFGGTGASGIPEIVKAIRKSGKPAAGVEIGAALMLPYFDLQPNDKAGDGLNTGAIDYATFNAKTKAALESYGQGGVDAMNRVIDSIYYIGDEEKHTALDYNEGSSGQKNDAHVAEFVAATAIVDFFTQERVPGSAYEFGIGDTTDKLRIGQFDNLSKQLIYTPLNSFVIAMRYYNDVVREKRASVNHATTFYQHFDLTNNLNKGVYSQIDDFLGVGSTNDWNFFSWIDEMARQVHAFAPYTITGDLYKVIADKPQRDRTIMGVGQKAATNDTSLNSRMNTITGTAADNSARPFFYALRQLGTQVNNNLR